MQKTKWIKLFIVFSFLIGLVACDSAKTSIAKLEAQGYKVEWIDPDDLQGQDLPFINVYSIADLRGNNIAFLFEFESREDIEKYFEDNDIDIEDYEEGVYKNILISGTEDHEDIAYLMEIIK